jgi:hypothetical protein
MRTSILQLALHKIKRFHKDEWCGCLTAAEGQALLDDGAHFHEATVSMHNHMMKQSKHGECGQTWYYFKLGRTKPDDIHRVSRNYHND